MQGRVISSLDVINVLDAINYEVKLPEDRSNERSHLINLDAIDALEESYTIFCQKELSDPYDPFTERNRQERRHGRFWKKPDYPKFRK